MSVWLGIGIALFAIWLVRTIGWLAKKGRGRFWRELAALFVAGYALGGTYTFRDQLQGSSLWLAAICLLVPFFVFAWRFVRLTGLAEFESLEEDGGFSAEDLIER